MTHPQQINVGRIIFILAFASLVEGCATATAVHEPRNYFDDDDGASVAQLMPISDRRTERVDHATMLNRARCTEPLLPAAEKQRQDDGGDDVFSVGDILEITVSDGEEFSGLVEISSDGMVDLPLIHKIDAVGLAPTALENQIAHRLVKDGYYKRGFAIINVQKKQSGARWVFVSGTVFQPGSYKVNDVDPKKLSSARDEATGGNAKDATVADALRRAGGIRPDADITNVVLVRNGERRVLDLSGAFTGKPMENPIVLSGDEINVPSRGCFQEQLARSSAVTAPGVRLYMSNLTQPASSNSTSAIGRDATNFPYGVRLLQAVVSANCVGGAHVSNANRYVVYMTKDWRTGRTVVVERPVEALVRRADRDNFNPFMQQGDAIACYDSAATNAREVIRMIGETVSPAILTLGLIGG